MTNPIHMYYQTITTLRRHMIQHSHFITTVRLSLKSDIHNAYTLSTTDSVVWHYINHSRDY